MSAKQVKAVREGVVALENTHALSIPYDAANPLFSTGAFTWMSQCQMGDALGAPRTLLMGRWDPANNQRSAALSFGDRGKMQVLVSAQGNTQENAAAVTTHPIADGEWRIIVAQYHPGKSLSIALYAPDGSPVDSRQTPAEVPGATFQAEAPFTIGASSRIGLVFKRAVVWDRFLSEEEITQALNEKSIGH